MGKYVNYINYLNYLFAYFRKQFTEKSRTIVFFFILMLFPSVDMKMFFGFLIILFSLVSDIRHKRIDLLTFLPFTRKMIYWFEFVFLVFLVFMSSMVSLPFYDKLTSGFTDLLSVVIFIAGYYGMIIILSMLWMDGVAAGFIVFIVDKMLSSFSTFKYYSYISPSTQENKLAALLFATVVLYFGQVMFEKKGGER